MTRKPPAPDDADQDILALVDAERFTQALELLMARYGKEIYRFCAQQLGDEALAADVQQQVHLAAYKDLQSFQRRSKLRTWLFAIARHRVLDAIKARRRWLARFRELSDSDDTPAEDSRPDIRLRNQLEEALAQLPPRVAAAVLLHYQQGFTFEEIAQMSGEKPGTVCARVARALETMRDYLENDRKRRRLLLSPVTR